jgi:asparagine synthase (glutamine-hydrolysing)
MCGLAGIVAWNGRPEGDDGAMGRALAAMQARGPDGSGVWRDRLCELGHLRLAVIDLSTKASQPMRSDCGRYMIVFNGEIYNFAEVKAEIGADYPWQSASDTEVILAAYVRWGTACLARFRGMFAIAIWDSELAELFVARDRLGVKPLYFHAGEGVFAFASRPRALYHLLPNLSRQFDRQAIRYYLEAGYIPAPYSCHEAIRKLEPGHFLRVNAQGLSKQCYWSLDAIAPDPALESASEEALLDQLDALIDDSVRLRLVSNVPVGAFLSGGIDSSLVAAYMRKHASGPVKTYTVSFEDPQYDESVHAQAVADHLHTEHLCEQMSPASLLALMPTYLAEYDEPFFDYSAFPVMAVSRLARRHVTVSLSGDGGDEAFGGYHYYRIAQALSTLQRFPRLLRLGVAALVGLLPGHKMRLLGSALKARDETSTFAFMRSVIKDFQQVLSPALREGTASLASLFAARRAAMPAGLSAAEAAMRLDLAFTLPDDYLQKVDVGSMAFSLEAREPLLDHPILEWAARLPLKWKLRGGINKYLLRQLAYRYVPKAILDRPKMGFGVPMGNWLRGPLLPWAQALLTDTPAMEALGLDAGAVRQLWDDHQRQAVQAQSCLWSILVLLQFYQDFETRNAHRH